MADNLTLSSAITVNTALDPGDFFHTWSRVSGAVEQLKASVRSVKDGIWRAAQGFEQLARSARGALSALMHVSNLAQGLDAGLMNLYRWSQGYGRAFSNTLDRLAASALYLKNSLGAMAMPLISAVAPAVDFVTDKLVGLFNLINQVFARLTGSSTYVAAKRTADAWDSVGGRISRATSALKRYIASFDQLNVLTDGASGSGSGGSGGGGGGVSTMFETREIDSALAGFVDSLKAALLASDWQALGTLLGEKVNTLVDGVDWAALGAKFGFYLNGAIQTAYYLLDAVNFENIGARAAEFLNNALAEIDFSTLGATVALFFAALAETFAGFVGTFDWGQLARKAAEAVNGFAETLGARLDAIDWAGLALRLTEGINGFIRDTDWALVGRTFAGRVNDLLAILGTAAASFDWKGAGAALAEGLNRLLGGVDWDGLGEWLNATMQGVLDVGLAFVEGFDAAGFAEGVGRALAKVDWDGVAQKLWALLSAALRKLGEALGALLLGGEADVSLNIELLRKGWSTVSKWLGVDSPLSALLGLKKDGWSSVEKFVGTAVTVLTKLKKDGWSSVEKYVGASVTVLTKLKKSGWSSIGKYVGTSVNVSTKLKKSGWSSIAKFVGTKVTVSASLSKASASEIKKALQAAMKGVSVSVAASGGGGKVTMMTKARGGVVTAAGRSLNFASGGAIVGHRASWWDGVRKYAAGTTRAHGTVFVAGEAGPEIMGHVNGRTEILNKSQLAQAIYGAVVSGMGRAVNALGLYLGSRVDACAEAVVAAIGGIGVAAGVTYRAPAMATGGVLPYDVAARVERAGEAIQGTLDANNEDLIQTILSAVGAQTTAIVSALQALERQGGRDGNGLTTRAVINQINQRARMFGESPLRG